MHVEIKRTSEHHVFQEFKTPTFARKVLSQ